MISHGEFRRIAGDVFGWPLDSVRERAPVGRSSFDKAKLSAVLERHLERKVPEGYIARTISPIEIAYCLTQQNPQMHFAARWCAKKALRKCDLRFAQVDASAIKLGANQDHTVFQRYMTGDGGGDDASTYCQCNAHARNGCCNRNHGLVGGRTND